MNSDMYIILCLCSKSLCENSVSVRWESVWVMVTSCEGIKSEAEDIQGKRRQKSVEVEAYPMKLQACGQVKTAYPMETASVEINPIFEQQLIVRHNSGLL